MSKRSGFDATITVDASFCPHSRCAGYAIWISYDKGPSRYTGRFKRKPKNSTQAEKWAILNGLTIAKKLGFKKVSLNSDCKPAMSGNGWCDDEMTVRYRHVKAHTSNAEPRFYVNRWADKHAKRHMRAWRDHERSVTSPEQN